MSKNLGTAVRNVESRPQNPGGDLPEGMASERPVKASKPHEPFHEFAERHYQYGKLAARRVHVCVSAAMAAAVFCTAGFAEGLFITAFLAIAGGSLVLLGFTRGCVSRGWDVVRRWRNNLKLQSRLRRQTRAEAGQT